MSFSYALDAVMRPEHSLYLVSQWVLCSNLRLLCFAVLCVWIVCEIAFYFALVHCVHPRLQKLNKSAPYHHTQSPVNTVLRIFDHIDLLGDYGWERFITGFFRGCKIEELKQGNLMSFLSWVMYSEYYCDLTETQQSEIAYIMKVAAKRFHYRPEPGYNPNVKHVNMTLESIPILHRPLIFYLCVYVGEFVFEILYLRLIGRFRKCEVAGMTYWFRDGAKIVRNDGTASSYVHPPILVLHGITNGWNTYGYMVHSLLTQVASSFNGTGPSRAMFLIDVNAIKIKSLCFDMPSPDDFPLQIQAVLDKHHVETVSVVGHSFGSITAGWLMRSCPHIASHLTLIDPVSLLLGLPEVAYHFLYRPPNDIIQQFILYGASRELTISHMLHRNFWWHRNICYLEDVPSHIPVCIAVSSEDPILDGPSVASYSRKCDALRAEMSVSQSQTQSALTIDVPALPTRVMGDGVKSSTKKRGRSSSRDGTKSPVTVIPELGDSTQSLNALVDALTEQLQEHHNKQQKERKDQIFTSPTYIEPTNTYFDNQQQTHHPKGAAKIHTIYWQGFTHGQFLASPSAMGELMAAIRTSEGILA